MILINYSLNIYFQDNSAVSNYGYEQNQAEVNYPDIPYAPGYGYDKSYVSPNR